MNYGSPLAANSNLMNALQHAWNGFAVIPCRPDKRPYLKGWPDAGTTNEPTIHSWWQQFPDAIAGLPCGPNSLLVVDCNRKGEGKPDGVANWEIACRSAAVDLSHCFTVETPSGGRHYYFRTNDGTSIGNTTGKLGEAIDTRGFGGFVIAPGSVLADGRRYRVLQGTIQSTVFLPETIRRFLLGKNGGEQTANEPTLPEQLQGTRETSTSRDRSYSAEALTREVAKLEATRSSRNQALHDSAFAMGTLVGAGRIGRTDVESALWEASRVNGYRAKDGDEAAWKTLQSGLTAGTKNPRLPLSKSDQPLFDFSHMKSNGTPLNFAARGSVAVGGDRLVIRCVADVQAEPISWLWPLRVASGKLTIIAGEPGLGKSQLAVFMAAKVTTGASWPNDDGRPPIGSVVMLSCEDDIADTIRPRLEAAGANLSLVQVIEGVRTGSGQMRGFSITEDLAPLEWALTQARDVKLVIVDPITAYLGGTKTHIAADVRAALAPLQELASRYRVAVVAVSHLNKSSGNGKSINAVTGSVAFVAASRATFLVTKDNGDPARRLFVQVKNNLAEAPGLAFRIQSKMLPSGINAAYVEFENGTVSITADEAIGDTSRTDDRSALDEAKEFLTAELGDGAIPAKDLLNRARDMRISEKTLRRAQKQLGIEPKKAGFQGEWVWTLPFNAAAIMNGMPKMANPVKDAHTESMAIFAPTWPPLAAPEDDVGKQ